MGDWRTNLLYWYDANKRNLPWRNISDPYKIWLSEIILQQTRVNQGWEYYLRFITKYPTVKELAKASEQDILKLWQGLGYYSRARNLHATAHIIINEHKGKFPKNYALLRALKGVGDYTAGAISSIAFDLPYPAVDGNVMRVYSRLFGISIPIDSTEGKKKLYEVAMELVPAKNPGTYNQAIMELGALICTPSKPKCEICPLLEACYAYKYKQVLEFPIKNGKTKQRNRHFNYLVIIHKNSVLLRLRGAKDIWQGLNDFPAIETAKPSSSVQFVKNKKWEEIIHLSKPVIKDISDEYIHILSHQKLFARFYQIVTPGKIANIPSGCFWVKINDIENYAVPKLIDLYIRKNILK